MHNISRGTHHNHYNHYGPPLDISRWLFGLGPDSIIESLEITYYILHITYQVEKKKKSGNVM